MESTTRGERLRQAREARGLSRDALGIKVGVRGGSIYRYERGENTPSSSLLFALADALGVSARWLELGDEPLPATGTEG